METFNIVILSGIVLAFVVFAAVLAWVIHSTGQVQQEVGNKVTQAKRPPKTASATIERDRAA